LSRMAKSSDLNAEKMYSLLAKLCTAEEIHDLLKPAKKNLPQERKAEVLISGNKEERIANLRRAVDAGLVQRTAIHELIREAEENGRQHIFYYVPKSKKLATELSSPAVVAGGLWGNNWEAKMDFPQFAILPPNAMWADFRHVKVAGSDYSYWVAKLYDTAVRRELVDTVRQSETRVVETYDIVTDRVVMLVRWHSYGLLEVRLPQGFSGKQYRQMHKLIWSHLAPVMSQDEFNKWDLATARGALLRDYVKNSHLYKLCGTDAEKDGYRTRLSPPSEEQTVENSDGQKEIVKVLIKSGANPEEIEVMWRPDGNNVVQDEFHCVVGGDDTNRVYLAKRLSAAEVDYVTNRLKELAG
jgi:hypothetical protein